MITPSLEYVFNCPSPPLHASLSFRSPNAIPIPQPLPIKLSPIPQLTYQHLISALPAPPMASFKRQAGQIIHRISQMFSPRRMSVSSTVRTHCKRSSTNSFFRVFQSRSNEAGRSANGAAVMSPMPSPSGHGNNLSENAPRDVWICHECKATNIRATSPDRCPVCKDQHYRCTLCEEVTTSMEQAVNERTEASPFSPE